MLNFKIAPYQKGTETVEAKEIKDSEVGPTGVFLSWQEVRLGVTFFPIHGCHHDFLPTLSSSTSKWRNAVSKTPPMSFHPRRRSHTLTGITLEQPEGMSGSCCCDWFRCRPLRLSFQRSEGVKQFLLSHTNCCHQMKKYIYKKKKENSTCIPMTA